MKNTKHTPTPWTTDGNTGETLRLVTSFDLGLEIANCNSEANAKHIIRCVNSFDSLVEALKTILNETETMGAEADNIYKVAKQALSQAEAL